MFQKKIIAILFIVTLLSTELIHISFMGGHLRPYHFLGPVVIIIFFDHFKKIALTVLPWTLIGFFIANALAAELADFPLDAYKSLGLLGCNMSIAFAVALILVSGRLSLDNMINIALFVAIISVVVGTIQVASLHLLGVDLSLTKVQAIQIDAGFSTGLRTEANTFAKNLNTVFLLALPVIMSYKNWCRTLITFAFFIVGMLTSLTRSALYGLLSSLFIIYILKFYRCNRHLFSKRTIYIFLFSLSAFFVFSSTVIYFNPYAAHKLTYFFDGEEILEGGSSGFRLMSQGILWDAFLRNDKTFWIGNGWGQVKFPYGDGEMQAGGAEIVVALGYGGVIGGFFYCLYMLTAIVKVFKTLNYRQDASSINTAFNRQREGVMFALIGLFVTGQINGAMIAPEYWMVFGMAMAISAIGRDPSAHFVTSQSFRSIR